jgi:hypothetical protein
MDEPSRKRDVGTHVTTIAGRTVPQTEQLASMLRAWCWPGESSDRSVPGAVEWLRRWGPARSGAALLDCSCARGRCAVCN